MKVSKYYCNNCGKETKDFYEFKQYFNKFSNNKEVSYGYSTTKHICLKCIREYIGFYFHISDNDRLHNFFAPLSKKEFKTGLKEYEKNRRKAI
jgi:hypothetical protein